MSKSKITLTCSECRQRNYRMAKSSVERLVLNKFCPVCKRHVEHREEK